MYETKALELNPLGTCRGTMPWLGRDVREDCNQPNRLLIRTASNAYFPQVLSLLSLPDRGAAVQTAVAELWDYLQIVDDQGATELGGYYIRMPDSAFVAYGDLLPECESRGVVWAGNKILYVASDTVSAAFQYEIRLDEVVAADVNGEIRAEGALPLDRPLQQMYAGLYFPIPAALEPFLVPRGTAEIRLELHCDWIDMRTAKHWTSKEAAAS